METLRIGRPPRAPRRRIVGDLLRALAWGAAVGLGAGAGITGWVMLASVW